MLAVVVVRGGMLPLGADEVVAECGGHVLAAVDDAAPADLAALDGVATEIEIADLGAFEPPRWAAHLADLTVSDDIVVLPASADGRDLAARLAHCRECDLFANAHRIDGATADLVVGGGFALARVEITGRAVLTMSPGVRTVTRIGTAHATPRHVAVPGDDPAAAVAQSGSVVTLELVAADATAVDLAEAPRIVAGGAGLDGPARFEQLTELGRRFDASVGTTRVVTDRGWLPHERQIGTTGVVVSPALYVAFAISGAVQHTTGLGSPEHIVSVNTDPFCPMMQLADLAIVADANEVLDALSALLLEPAVSWS